jgi:hypothetical protein
MIKKSSIKIAKIIQVENPIIEKVTRDYGLTTVESSMFLVLNDFFEFKFQEFIEIIKILPKSYGPNPTKQRLEDSIEWLKAVHKMRPKYYVHKYINSQGIPDYSEWTPVFVTAIYNTRNYDSLRY